MQQTIPSTITTTRYAGFWIRAAALIIDVIITGAIATILSRMFFGSYYPRFQGDQDPGPGAMSLLVNWLYFAWQESSVRQATFGKLAVGIKVCSEGGERLTFANATGRYFAKILSALIFFIGFIMAATNEKKQALHDKLARTLVIYS
jgi:uncharacterized RDD family membrane protein YckC